jgi:hypothetical protein
MTNTMKVVEHAKDIGGSVIVRKPRQKATKNPTSQEKDRAEVTNGRTQ